VSLGKYVITAGIFLIYICSYRYKNVNINQNIIEFNSAIHKLSLIIDYILYSLIAYKNQEVLTDMLEEFAFPHTCLDLF